MRKLSLLLSALSLSIFISAQVPQALNYQAVARNSLGQIVPSQSIGVRFSITDANGATTFYQETHNTTTNNFGLFTLAIGKGTPVSGTMAAIDWSTGDKYLKVEIAPQGGTNYTIQGMTQLLSVPYALYSEKTKLIAGTGITITGGNTISSNSWLLNGNGGTTAANYLGTSDNQPFRIRTNNVSRLSFNAGVIDPFSGNVGTVFVSDFNSLGTSPGQLAIYGKDIPGISMPAFFANSVQGMTWAPQGGANNTMGRFFRLIQHTTNNEGDGQFYDFGMDQGKSFFISDQGFQNGGPVFFKKMITITPQDFVGINFNWGESPTANFHTKGTVRFEGITTDNTQSRVLVMDNNGNVSSRDASTLGGGGGSGWALTGNAGTTAANYLGTSDNQSFRIRTNNVTRLSFNAGVVDPFSGNVGTVFVSDFNSLSTAPGQLAIYGKDIPGISMPAFFANSVQGMTWAPQGGANNTMGRFFRLIQHTTNNEGDGQFYDFGMDQGKSFFISDQGFQNGGPVFFKKMITITPQDFVGINFNWGEDPTANFHTKGTVRFEGINTNNALTRVVVMDNNGNVSSRDASTLGGGGYWLPDGNGIYYNAANVGIGGNSRNDAALAVTGQASENWALDITSPNSWETAINIKNSSTPNAYYQLLVGGSTNNQPTEGVGVANFGILNARDGLNTTIPFIITKDDYVGISGGNMSNGNGGTNFTPKARLHVQNGDIYIENITSGVIMKSPNGQCWRMTVSNAGTPVFTAIPCP